MNTGGPAFPLPINDPHWKVSKKEFREQDCCGMTLRDYFAAAALQGAVASYREGRCEKTRQELAEGCYQYADAMIAAREKGSK